MTKQQIKKELLSYLLLIVIAFMAAYIINHGIIANAKVPTGSMENTIMTNDKIVAFRLSYLFTEPKRGDIVVFKYPDDEKQDYLKRIIGLPGETIEIIDGKVYINHQKEPLEEPYLKETPIGTFGTYEVPENCYFMMGDNRNNSEDSRYWKNTYVEREKIVGKAIFKYFPSCRLLE